MKKQSNGRRELGLSLIESAMVLAISAVVISGVLYYYNLVQENRKLEEGVKQIQTIAATINKLYSNSAAEMSGVNYIVDAVSAVSGIPTVYLEEIGGPVFTTPTGTYTQFWYNPDNSYTLETRAQTVSACMSYATLNFGSIMAKKTQVDNNNDNYTTPYYLSPEEASKQCELAIANGTKIAKIRHILRY